MLKQIGKEKEWLFSELSNHKHTNTKEIAYGEWSETEGFLLKHIKKSTRFPYEQNLIFIVFGMLWTGTVHSKYPSETEIRGIFIHGTKISGDFPVKSK